VVLSSVLLLPQASTCLTSLVSNTAQDDSKQKETLAEARLKPCKAIKADTAAKDFHPKTKALTNGDFKSNKLKVQESKVLPTQPINF
jgi:hypothetical protein